MILFVSGATQTVKRFRHHAHIGVLKTPRDRQPMKTITDLGLPWGADNDCFGGLDPDSYLAMLDKIKAADQSNLKFITVPDIWSDYHSTLALFKYWYPALEKRKLPAALVAQDGLTPDRVPWDKIAALFIGGSNRWRLSKAAALLIRYAQRNGKWVHVGRVNSLRRLGYMQALEVNSVDGSGYSRFPDTYIPQALTRLTVTQPGFSGLVLVNGVDPFAMEAQP